ncbi:MAG TPA: universal stress protein [Blastocatellia bacterium]|nr:universal stress protein [Blastocatellia bacterium]
MKVLLATDGSAQATQALWTAIRLLRHGDNRFDLLCVAPEFYPPHHRLKKDSRKTAHMIETYRQQISVEARQRMIHTQAVLAAQGIQAEIRVEIGSPARVIVRAASDYDLTVVGAHDRYSRSKPGLGPVASRVVASAPGAVLVGRELAEGRNWRILAAVDGSLASEHALNLMVSYLRVASAEITLMHVAETPWIHLGLDREWFDYPINVPDRDGNGVEYEFEDELRYEGRTVIENARRVLERYGLTASTVIAEGDPALEILSEVESGDYDLVVLGATGEADLKHNMLGSVSTRVAQDAPCPVFVAKFVE